MVAALVAFAIMIFALEGGRAKKAEKEFVDKLREGYLKLADKKYALERYEKIKSYYLRHERMGRSTILHGMISEWMRSLRG